MTDRKFAGGKEFPRVSGPYNRWHKGRPIALDGDRPVAGGRLHKVQPPLDCFGLEWSICQQTIGKMPLRSRRAVGSWAFNWSGLVSRRDWCDNWQVLRTVAVMCMGSLRRPTWIEDILHSLRRRSASYSLYEQSYYTSY